MNGPEVGVVGIYIGNLKGANEWELRLAAVVVKEERGARGEAACHPKESSIDKRFAKGNGAVQEESWSMETRSSQVYCWDEG